MSDPPEIAPFHTFLGLRTVSRQGGEAEVEITLDEHHTNKKELAHGGVMTAVLDAALGQAVIAAIGPEEWCATLSINVVFMRGPQVGETIRARGRSTGRGKRVAFAQGEAEDSRGRTLATAEGVWYVWPSKPEHPPSVKS
jgi:uncharacterized protein (TIGR00369 family)